MDSALCLHYGALHIPSITNRAAIIARPYSSFRPSSLSLSSKASTYRSLSRHAFSSPVICALNKPSTPSPNYDKDNGKKIVRVVGGASVVLACVLGIINCNNKFSPTAIASERDLKAKPQLVLTRPKDVLASLLKVKENLAKPKISRWSMTSTNLKLPDEPQPGAVDTFKEDLDRFKSTVAYLIKLGKSHKVEKQLRQFIKEKRGIPAYEAEMELVLLLIFQGRYQEALKCTCLDDQSPQGFGINSDGRVHLYKVPLSIRMVEFLSFYKAIIYTMLDRDKEAKKCWKSFIRGFSSPLNQIPPEQFK